MRRFPAGGRPLAAALCAISVASALPSGVLGQEISGAWDADDRVLITDFQRVTALARSPDRLFAATDGGLVVLSDAFGHWELPITREDGWPAAQVLALGWDGRDGTLWLATRDGRLLQLDMAGRRWLDGFSVPGAVERIVAAADDPSRLLLRRGERWYALDPFTRDLQPVSSGVVQQAIGTDFDLRARRDLLTDPTWQAAQPFLGRRGHERYAVTDVMPSAGGSGEFWVATYGGFLERYDSFSGNSEPVDYGMVGIGAAAVLVADETLWFAPRHASDRYGVAAADPALEEWSTWGGAALGFGSRGAPDAPIRAWLRLGDDTWAGGDRGLHRFDGERWHQESLGRRADVAPITSLAAGPAGLPGVWVGTERGLLRIRSAGAQPDVLMLSATRVRSLAVHDGDLWVGTEAGLVRLRGDDPLAGDPGVGDAEGEDGGAEDAEVGRAPVRPEEDAERAATVPMPEDVGPPGRVGALAADGGRLYAGIERGVWVLDRADWSRAAPLGVLAARVSALAAHDGVLWVGTDEGLVAWETQEDVVRQFTFAAGDLPTGSRGERGVTGIAVEPGGAVWAATPAGAVRLDGSW